MLKSGVKPSIRRTGAEIIDFLVFRNKSLKEAYGPIAAKNGMKCYSLYRISKFEVVSNISYMLIVN
jgi:hypothetical protein